MKSSSPVSTIIVSTSRCGSVRTEDEEPGWLNMSNSLLESIREAEIVQKNNYN